LGIKGKNPIYHGVYDNGIYNFPIESGNGRFHPTQKPLNLIKALIEKHSNEDDTVVDVFSGSATTAVASIQTKRNFLGCELDSNYFEQSISRIRNLNNPELILDIQPIKDEE
jgi:site-specific DNA-methyltransferase (adenine-specific)